MNIPKDKIQWKKVKYLRIGQSFDYEYEFWLNEPLASWDVYDYWEFARVKSMQQHLKKGDILFDIGTELGWCNLAYAAMVGPSKMVLIEPTPEFWPNIKALWEKNFVVPPLACYSGLFSDKTTHGAVLLKQTFPPESNGDLLDHNSYKYIHEHGNVIPQITLDDYVGATGIIPNALTIDTEGSELLILKGAEKTLTNNEVKVWVSEHDQLAEQNYGVKKGELQEYMKSLGYVGQFLGEDHETHKLYTKNI